MTPPTDPYWADREPPASDFDLLDSYFTDPDIVVDNPVPKKASKALSTAEVKRRMT